MKKNFSRVASLALAVMMLISLLPAGVLASTADDTVTLTGTISFPDDAYLEGELVIDVHAYGKNTETHRYWQDWTWDLDDIPFSIEFPAGESLVCIDVQLSNTYETKTNLYTSNNGAGGFILTDDGMDADADFFKNYFSFEEIAAADIVMPTGKEVSGTITGEKLQVVDGEFLTIWFGDYFTCACIDSETHEYKTVLPYGITAGEYTPYIAKGMIENDGTHMFESAASNILLGEYYSDTVTVEPESDIEGVDFKVDTGYALSGRVKFPKDASYEYYVFSPMLRFGNFKYYINTSFTGISYDADGDCLPYMIGIPQSEPPVSGIFNLYLYGYEDEVDGAYPYSNIEEGDYYYSSESENGTVRDEASATELTITEDTEEINFCLDAGIFFSLEPTMPEGACSSSFYYSFEIVPIDGSESFQVWKRFNIQNEENYISFILPKEYIDKEVYYVYAVDEASVSEDSTLYTGEVYLCRNGSMVTSREEADTFLVEEWNEISFEFIEDGNITPPVTPEVPEEYTVYFSIKDEDTNEEIPYASLVVTDALAATTAGGTTLQANGSGWANGTFTAGTYTVTASADGYIPSTIPFEAVMNNQTILIELKKEAVTPDVPVLFKTFFVVLDEETQETIPNALITIVDAEAASTSGAISLSTGTEGEMAIAELSAGTYTVTTSADGYVTDTRKVVVSDESQHEIIQLERSEIDIADNTTFTVRDGDTESTPVIAGASLTITDADGNAVTRSTDASGKATLDLENGTYTVGVIADGYQARSFKIERSDTNNDFTVYLNKDEIIKVTSTVREMTKEEIENAGISVDENRHVYNCSAVLTFMPDVVINYIYSDDGKVLDGKTVVHDNVAVTPVARDIFLIVKSSTAWLKEIFEVQLVCDNTSAVETIENLIANMTIPDGLSLAKMAEGEQSENVNLGDVAPKGNASHKWYICGDEKGEYTLSGTLSGTRVGGSISEDINLGFSIEEPITVLAGEAMKLTIEAETHAIAGSPYRMRYTLENVSDKSLYDLSFTVFGGRFFEDYNVIAAEYAREYGPDAMTDENLDGEGFLFETEEFAPGEKISGVFTITFGEGLELGEGHGWHLTDAFVVTGAGSTTEIPTTIEWIDVLPVHNWDGGTVTTAPTCTTAGIMTYTCQDTDCDLENKTYTATIPATGHNMSDYVTTDPTCTEDGTMVSTCKNNCGHSVTLTIGKLGHDMGNWTTTVEPGCESTGTKRSDCTRCDYFETEVIDSLGHDWKAEKEEDKAPTCTEPGSKSIHCTRCAETKDAEEIPALGHDMGDWTTTVEPGCESEGEKKSDCSRCDHYTTNTIPATDHKWGEGEVTTPPTEDAEGERTYTCENGCGKTKTEVIEKLVPQDVDFAVPGDITYTYGDERAIYNEAENYSQDGGAVSYTSSDESVATVEAGGKVTIVGAGETTITATAAATEKYTETSVSYKFIVKKAPLTVKPKTVEIFYGEVAAFSEVEGEGFVLGEDVSVLTGDAVFATDYKAFDNAGEYAVTVSGITAKNYEVTFVPGVLNVKKAEKHELVISKLSYRKGDEIKPEISVTPADTSAEFKLEYNTDGKWTETAPTEIGTYKVRASLAKSDNIAISETPAYTEAELEIKAGAMITVGKEGGLEIDMETDEEKGTVEFKADDETVKTVIDNVPSTGEVVIDATGASDGINTLVLPENIVKALDESEKVDSFTVIADEVEITMDADVLSTAAKEMGEKSTLSVKIDPIEDKSKLTKKQQEALDAISTEAHVIQLNLVVTNYDENGKETGKDIHELRGKVDIKAKYELPENMDGKKIVVCYVSDNGTVTYKRAEYKDGFVYFTTDHFSHYAIAAVECEHEWGSGEVVTPATTSSEGLMRYTCGICFDTKEEAIPKKSLTPSTGNGGGLAAGGDKSNTGADKLGETESDNTDASDKTDTPVVSSPRFADLGNHSWAADAINALAEAGIIKGTAADKFSPAANITRADFAILLVRAFGLTSDNTENFADVNASDYFAAELAVARNTGIVGGIGGNKFAPRNAITRQDMMTIVYRALQNAKIDGIVAPEMTDEVALSKTYTDFTLVSDYAKDAVSVLSYMHFVNGKNGRIAPTDYTTRAEVAVLLQRILEYVK